MLKLPVCNERLFLRSPSIYVCFRTVVEGIVTKTKIEQTLKIIYKRHPLIRCRIEIDDDGGAWFIQDGNPIDVEYYTSALTNWLEWYKRAENTPFDISRGPLAKICAIVDGDTTEICILGHHVIGDGIGWLNFTKDLLLALDKNLDEAPQIPPTDSGDKYFKETILLDEPTKSFACWLNGEWRKNCVRLSEGDYVSFFRRYHEELKPNLHMGSIEESDFVKITQKCRENDLSVNEIIATAFTAALTDRETRLGVAANIRNELISEPSHCMGNYVSGVSASVRYEPENTFLENARRIANALRAHLTNLKTRHMAVHFLNEFDGDFLESVVYAAYGGFELPFSKQLGELIGERPDNKGIGVSNLGKNDLTGYGKIKILDMQFIGPAFPANLLTVGAITAGSRLNLCLRYNESEISSDEIRTVYGKAIELLTE